MVLGRSWRALKALARKFAGAKRGNVAMIFALSLIPITVAAGAGLDLSRALMARARLAEALDAAGLAIGASKGLTTDQVTSLARAYFNANYTADPSFGTPAPVTVTQGNEAVTLSTSISMPTTLMRIVGIDSLSVGYTSKVVWGQTKLWVSLVLDNTGSMTETDNTGTSKISALKTATTQLLSTLQNSSATPGDVKVAIIPFSKTVNLGTSFVNASWLDWTDWESAPANSMPGSSVGPGSSCPYGSNTSPYGYSCQIDPSNGSNTTSNIPALQGNYSASASYSSGDVVLYNSIYYVATRSSSGRTPNSNPNSWQSETQDISGYICPTVDNGRYNNGRSGHYYNGCYDSVPSSQTTTTTCTSVNGGSPSCTTTITAGTYTGSTQPVTSQSCTGSHGDRTCTTSTVTRTGAPYTHTWHANSHSTWGGCLEDRDQDFDVSNTVPNGSTAGFPPENAQSCVPSQMMAALSDDWTALNNEVNNMSAGGNTNQPIGLAWGWQAQTDGDPMNPGAVPNNTSQYIILLSDGLNTQDRWYPDQTSIDNRMSLVCANAKAAGMTIYTIFVDLNGTQGNSTVLQNCASDPSKYFDLTTSGAIISTLNNIAQQITELRVAQ